MKKIISLFLTLTMMLSALALISATAAEANAISVDGKEMTWSAFVTEANTKGADDKAPTYEGKTLKLLTDVTLTGDWTSLSEFKGTLDGNGKSISGLNAPLFNTLTDATVKNLTLNGTITFTGNRCGALAMTAAGTQVTVENCVNNCVINFTETGSNAAAGGFIGYTEKKVVFTDCVNNGDINAGSANKIAVCIGGIIGYVKNATSEIVATDCVNNGTLITNVISADGKSSNTSIAGGIAAWVTGTGAFTKCLNTAQIKNISAVSAGGHKLGGIVGVNDRTTANLTIDSCINTGNVNGFCQAGGIVGESKSLKLMMTNCYNYGAMTSGGDTAVKTNSIAGGLIAYQRQGELVMTACANFGSINAKLNKSDATTVFAGGLIGWTDTAVSVSYCSNNATVTSGRIAGGLLGWANKADAAMTFTECFAAEKVELIAEPLAENAAAALVGKINAGDVTLATSKHLTTVNAVSVNGTAKDPSGTEYTVADAAAWRALQSINFEGVQYTAAADGKFNVRLVSSLSSIDYLNAGYEVVRIVNGKDLGATDAEIKVVYKSLLGFDEAGSRNQYLASQFGAEYLSALVIKNVPANATVTFIVRPYLKSTDGSTTVYGEAYTVTFTNGAVAG